MVFVRAIINRESVIIYYQVFITFFSLLIEKFDLPNRQRHHSDPNVEGFYQKVFISNIDAKQIIGKSDFSLVSLQLISKLILGLGHYLSTIDLQQCLQRWQLKYTLILYQVHFKRGITCLGIKETTGLFYKLIDLTKATTLVKYYNYLDKVLYK